MPLSPMMEGLAHTCVRLKNSAVREQSGGWATRWEDGETFKVYPIRDTSTLAQIAEREGAE